MNTTALASAVAGFLLGGLVASTAASLEDGPDHAQKAPAISDTSTGH